MNEELLNTVKELNKTPEATLDPVSILESLYKSILTNEINLFFILLMLFIFINVMFFQNSYFGRLFRSSASAILPSIGILGTFVGVFIVILNFNYQDLDYSIQNIVRGLQTAFVTSIFGLLSGIIVKIKQSSQPEINAEDGIGPEELWSELKQLRSENSKNNDKLINAISGDSDSSLNTQIKLMRSDLNDFAKTVAEANTTAFIDALKQAIADFNKNLTDQFGENFKQLNEAVGKLLDWQENHKQDMDNLRDSIDKSVEGIKESENALQKIQESTKKIPNYMEGLEKVLKAVDHQINNLENHLKTFDEISNNAKDALPRIEEVLNNYTNGLEKTFEDIVSQFNQSIEKQKVSYSTLEDTFNNVMTDFKNLGSELKQDINDITSDLKSQTNEMLGSIKNTTEDIISNFNDTSKITITEFSEKSNKTIQSISEIVSEHSNLTKNLSKELSDQVEVIGKNLSEKLNVVVQDMTEAFKTSLKNSQELQQNSLDDFSTKLTNEYSNSADNLRTITEDLLQQTRANTEKILNEELQGFSDRLGSIANRMAEQLGPLADSFRKAVETIKKKNDI